MIGKLLETLFRHKLLALLPPVLIPVVVGSIGFVTAPAYYETWAGVWVTRPTLLSYSDDWNQYNTPAQNQGGRLTELLKTASFLTDVAKRTALAPVVDRPLANERLQSLITQQLTLLPSGNNLLTMRYRAASPELAVQVLGAVLDAYKERTTSDRTNQGTLAISFYESRLQDAQQKLGDANDALRRYTLANPRLADPSRDLAGLAAPLADPQLAELQRSFEANQHDVEQARASLDKARLDVDAGLEGQELGFQVLDSPRTTTGATRDLRRIIIIPIAGLLVGLIFSTIMLVLLMASDRSVRTAPDIVPPVRVLGAVPLLKVKGLRKQDRTNATRRAIGFPAGTALPLPKGTT